MSVDIDLFPHKHIERYNNLGYAQDENLISFRKNCFDNLDAEILEYPLHEPLIAEDQVPLGDMLYTFIFSNFLILSRKACEIVKKFKSNNCTFYNFPFYHNARLYDKGDYQLLYFHYDYSKNLDFSQVVFNFNFYNDGVSTYDNKIQFKNFSDFKNFVSPKISGIERINRNFNRCDNIVFTSINHDIFFVDNCFQNPIVSEELKYELQKACFGLYFSDAEIKISSNQK